MILFEGDNPHAKMTLYSSHLSELNDRDNKHNGCKTRNKLSIDNHKLIFVQTQDLSRRYVEDQRAKCASEDTSVRDSTNCISFRPRYLRRKTK